MTRVIFAILVLLILPISSLAAEQVQESPEKIQALSIGESAPDALIAGTDGKEQLLASMIKDKATVLIFYRGGW